MAKSIFRDKGAPPEEALLGAALDTALALWDGLVAHVAGTYPSVVPEWKYYGAGWGWCLVLNSKKKKLVYLAPEKGCFVCALNFNEKGRELARQAGFAADVMEIIESGKDNTAGQTFDITVDSEDAFTLVKRLLEIKNAC